MNKTSSGNTDKSVKTQRLHDEVALSNCIQRKTFRLLSERSSFSVIRWGIFWIISRRRISFLLLRNNIWGEFLPMCIFWINASNEGGNKIYLRWKARASFIFVTPRRLLQVIWTRVRLDSTSVVATFWSLSAVYLNILHLAERIVHYAFTIFNYTIIRNSLVCREMKDKAQIYSRV
jgi:hypothetical protein